MTAVLLLLATFGSQELAAEVLGETAPPLVVSSLDDTLAVTDEAVPTLDSSPAPPGFSLAEEAGDPKLTVDSSAAELLDVYLDQIDRLQTLNGTYHPSLAESLSGMALLLQTHGDHDGAITAYQRAMHIQRVNNGIYSVSQEPMLRGIISSQSALGDLEAVGTHFDQLLWLYGRDFGPDDPRLLPLVEEISDWHVQAYNRNPSRKAVQHLVRAHGLMADAIERISQPIAGGNLMALPLLRNLVMVNYYLADHQRRYPIGSQEGFSMRASAGGMAEPLSRDELLVVNSYHNGRRAQEHIVATLMTAPNATTLEQVEALAELGDWYLLFGRANSAQQAYRQAWQIAEADSDTSPLLPELFGTPRLITLQRGGQGAVSAAGSEGTGSAEIFTRLTIGARGEVRDTEILEVRADDDLELSSSAIRELRKLRFRPRLIDGTMAGSEGVEYTLALQL